jgi:hypothetical protein
MAQEAPATAGPIVKVCPCCRKGLTAEGWKALEYVGIQRMEAMDDLPEVKFELRNCTCGSTILMPA